jgi:rRNA processing protein Gar1
MLEVCGEGIECCDHVGWFRVVLGRVKYPFVLVFVSIRVSKRVSEIEVNREIPATGHRTTDLRNQVYIFPDWV